MLICKMGTILVPISHVTVACGMHRPGASIDIIGLYIIIF